MTWFVYHNLETASTLQWEMWYTSNTLFEAHYVLLELYCFM